MSRGDELKLARCIMNRKRPSVDGRTTEAFSQAVICSQTKGPQLSKLTSSKPVLSSSRLSKVTIATATVRTVSCRWGRATAG